MTRSVLLWGALATLVLAGCERAVVEAERRAGEDELAAAAAEREVRRAQESVAGQKLALAERENSTARAQEQLGQLQATLAQLWNGNPKELQALASDAKVPKASVAYLEAAQRAAASTTLEVRFRLAMEAENFGLLGELFEGSERAHGLVPNQAAPQQQPDREQECERQQVQLKCQPLPSDDPSLAKAAQLCRGDGASYLVSVEDGAFAARETAMTDETLRLVAALAPDWWVIRRDFPALMTSRSADRETLVDSKGWISFLQLSDRSAVERMAIAVEAKDRKVTFERVDLDDDGTPEVLLVAPDSVRAVHLVPRSSTLTLWSSEETCRLLRAESSPPGARERCAELDRQAKEAALAAAKAAQLAEAIAKAWPPQRAVVALRYAVLHCDHAAAMGLLSKETVASFQRRGAEPPGGLEEVLKEKCKQAQSSSARWQGFTTGKVEVVGRFASVELISPDRSSTVVGLVFEDSAWKVTGAEALEAR